MRRLPFFSVTSMRPSGRKARAQGSSNEVIGLTSNGRFLGLRNGGDEQAERHCESLNRHREVRLRDAMDY